MATRSGASASSRGFPRCRKRRRLTACAANWASATPTALVACATELEHLIEREGADSIAAFVAEPIIGSTAGAVVPPDEYWPKIADICRRHNILLIADEVMTGFGRTGRRFAVEHWNITPDILVGGKGLAGGYAPMGAIFAREEVVAPIAARGDELMFYTFSAHPACCAAADTVLDIMEREGLVDRAAEMGRKLRQRLSALESHPNVAEIRGRGLLLGIELVKDRDTLEPFPEADGRDTEGDHGRSRRRRLLLSWRQRSGT